MSIVEGEGVADSVAVDVVEGEGVADSVAVDVVEGEGVADSVAVDVVDGAGVATCADLARLAMLSCFWLVFLCLPVLGF